VADPPGYLRILPSSSHEKTPHQHQIRHCGCIQCRLLSPLPTTPIPRNDKFDFCLEAPRRHRLLYPGRQIYFTSQRHGALNRVLPSRRALTARTTRSALSGHSSPPFEIHTLTGLIQVARLQQLFYFQFPNISNVCYSVAPISKIAKPNNCSGESFTLEVGG